MKNSYVNVAFAIGEHLSLFMFALKLYTRTSLQCSIEQKIDIYIYIYVNIYA